MQCVQGAFHRENASNPDKGCFDLLKKKKKRKIKKQSSMAIPHAWLTSLCYIHETSHQMLLDTFQLTFFSISVSYPPITSFEYFYRSLYIKTQFQFLFFLSLLLLIFIVFAF